MPLRHVRELTTHERAALTELYKTSPVTELVRRSHAILLSVDGWQATKIGELLHQLSDHKRSSDFQQCVDRQIIPAYPEVDLFFLIEEQYLENCKLISLIRT